MPHRTLEIVVVANKSGSTVETPTAAGHAWRAFADAELLAEINPGRFVIVTAGAALGDRQEMGAHLILATSRQGRSRRPRSTWWARAGRAWTGRHLGKADELATRSPAATAALALGAALGAAALAGLTKVFEFDDRPRHPGPGRAGQAAHRQGPRARLFRGILPVVVERTITPAASDDDAHHRLCHRAGRRWLWRRSQTAASAARQPVMAVGAQFLAWRVATALARRCSGSSPFRRSGRPRRGNTKGDPAGRAARAHVLGRRPGYTWRTWARPRRCEDTNQR
ncbi:hypothetical protein ACFQX7_10145 [Luedemannella flava]